MLIPNTKTISYAGILIAGVPDIRADENSSKALHNAVLLPGATS